MIRALPEEVRKVSLPTVAINGEPSQENLTDKWLPWMHIPEGKEGNKDKEIIELWCKGASAKQISKIVYSKKTTVHNVISKLRKNYPEAKIPKDRERKSMRF